MGLSLPFKKLDHEDQDINPDLALEIGHLFKSARQDLNLTILDVAGSIHIRRLYLEAIENGEFSILPGNVYLVGFIKIYAKFLDLDGDEILRRLNLLTTPIQKATMPPLSIPMDQQEQPSFSMTTFLSLGAIFLLGCLWFYHHFGQTPDGLGETTHILHEEAASPSLDGMSEQEHFASVTHPHETTSPEIAPLETGTLLPQQPHLPDHSTTSTLPPVNEQMPTAVITSDALPSSTEPSLKTTPRQKKPVITVKAVEDTWVQILGKNNTPLYVRVMKAGDQFAIPEDNIAVLNTGNAGGLQIAIDDEALPTLGQKGKVIKGISLDEKSVRDFYAQKESANAA